MTIEERDKQRLLDWYAAGYRRLPWRETRDPYRIMVSEIMLQQTQAERVIPKYLEFIERFPTLQALADAPTGEVIRAWAGLGYNRRAVNLQRACREVVMRHAGVMPGEVGELLALPGIGPYTAGAIACFAYGADVGFVDTNIRRVLQRVVAGSEFREPRLSAAELQRAAGEVVPVGHGYAWNQALMELGATLCRARSVACEACPLAETCRARPVIAADLASAPRRRVAGAVPFERTSRYLRGRLIDALRAAPVGGLSLAELVAVAQSNGAAARWSSVDIAGHLSNLVSDGLVERAMPEGLAETAPEYDGLPAPGERFRLPE